MKLREMADRYPNRKECADEMNITVGNLNMLISRGRGIEKMANGGWILINEKHKIFNFSKCHKPLVF